MKKQSKHLSIALAILILLVAVAASAQPGQGRRGDGQMGMNRNFDQDGFQGRGFGLQMLDLSDEQQQSIDKIREDGQTRNVETRKEMMRLQNELDGIMLADAPDSAKARKLIASMGKLRTDRQVAHMEQRLEIRKLLTSEQRDMLIAHQGMRGGHGQRGGRNKCGHRGFGGANGFGPGYSDCDGDGSYGQRGNRGQGYRR